MKYVEVTVVGPCPTCRGREPEIEGCLACDGWGEVPETRKVYDLIGLHELFTEIRRHNLKETA